jgi:hypothetical protein
MKPRKTKPRTNNKVTHTYQTPKAAASTQGQPKDGIGPFTPGELPRQSHAEPSTIRTIVKLDQRSMVWAYEGVATEVEAMGPCMALVCAILASVSFWVSYSSIFILDDSDASLAARIAMSIVMLALAAGTVVFMIYLLKISLFSRYGDLHFNRKTGKIYSSENNMTLQMDWRHVRPAVRLGFGPVQLGAPPLMSLMLIEYFPDRPQEWKSRMTVAGPLPNRDGCQQVWEMIRRYMEEPPESLPEVEVVPGGRNWISTLVEFGPLTGFLTTVPEMIAQLRANNWRPSINPLNILWWIVAWSFPLSTTLYARYRPKVRLPESWTKEEALLQGEQNLYRISTRDPREAAGRRKAARIIGAVCGLCIVTGMVLWGIGLYCVWLALL